MGGGGGGGELKNIYSRGADMYIVHMWHPRHV